MALNLAYNYAEIDPDSKMCIGVQTTSGEYDLSDPAFANLVEIPVYDPEYVLKFYIDGNWYEDPDGTIPWTSSLL
jgi:hypothetical protein